MHQQHQQHFLNNSKILERVMERSCCKHYQRLNLAASPNMVRMLTPGEVEADSSRISTAKSQYNLCRTYSILLVLLNQLSDDPHGSFPFDGDIHTLDGNLNLNLFTPINQFTLFFVSLIDFYSAALASL